MITKMGVKSKARWEEVKPHLSISQSITAKQLSEALGVSHTSAYEFLSRFVRYGLVKRGGSRYDKRGQQQFFLRQELTI